MKIEKPEDCIRICKSYRGSNLYVISSAERIDISIENKDQFKTISALALVERLINELLEEGRGVEDLAATCFECSLSSADLPGILSEALVHLFIDKKQSVSKVVE